EHHHHPRPRRAPARRPPPAPMGAGAHRGAHAAPLVGSAAARKARPAFPAAPLPGSAAPTRVAAAPGGEGAARLGHRRRDVRLRAGVHAARLPLRAVRQRHRADPEHARRRVPDAPAHHGELQAGDLPPRPRQPSVGAAGRAGGGAGLPGASELAESGERQQARRAAHRLRHRGGGDGLPRPRPAGGHPEARRHRRLRRALAPGIRRHDAVAEGARPLRGADRQPHDGGDGAHRDRSVLRRRRQRGAVRGELPPAHQGAAGVRRGPRGDQAQAGRGPRSDEAPAGGAAAARRGRAVPGRAREVGARLLGAGDADRLHLRLRQPDGPRGRHGDRLPDPVQRHLRASARVRHAEGDGVHELLSQPGGAVGGAYPGGAGLPAGLGPVLAPLQPGRPSHLPAAEHDRGPRHHRVPADLRHVRAGRPAGDAEAPRRRPGGHVL
ncbi:MAG: ABC exporter permease subunit of DevC family, partial [uncultured Acetobacteraceae bacterium]